MGGLSNDCVHSMYFCLEFSTKNRTCLNIDLGMIQSRFHFELYLSFIQRVPLKILWQLLFSISEICWSKLSQNHLKDPLPL